MRHLILASAIALFSLSTNLQAEKPVDALKLDLSTGGAVTIQLLSDIAPLHTIRLKELTRDGFYDGIIFHRVIKGFMAQTGDPSGTGSGGSKKPDLTAEFSPYQYRRGTVGMARTRNPNSANSQFFICFDNHGCRSLTGSYTVLGQVVEGMEFVDKIAVGQPPSKPDRIVKASVIKYVPKPEPKKVEADDSIPGLDEVL